jgi:hypothetical protein
MTKKEAISALENLFELNKAQGHLSSVDAIKFSKAISALKNGKKEEAASEDEQDHE